MKNIRINNDLAIRWKIERLGQPELLEGKIVRVRVIDKLGAVAKTTTKVEANVITIIFRAQDQRRVGTYTAIAEFGTNSTPTTTLDKCDLFTLVPHSCQECLCNSIDPDGTVWIDTASNLVVPANGADGTGIANIEQTETSEESGGVNTLTVTLTDGRTFSFQVRNGKDGAPGEPGYTPQKGIDYFDGEPGYTPQKGIDYFDGKDGKDGKDGVSGGFLFPSFNYDPETGILRVSGLEAEMQRLSFDEASSELVIKF